MHLRRRAQPVQVLIPEPAQPTPVTTRPVRTAAPMTVLAAQTDVLQPLRLLRRPLVQEPTSNLVPLLPHATTARVLMDATGQTGVRQVATLLRSVQEPTSNQVQHTPRAITAFAPAGAPGALTAVPLAVCHQHQAVLLVSIGALRTIHAFQIPSLVHQPGVRNVVRACTGVPV